MTGASLIHNIEISVSALEGVSCLTARKLQLQSVVRESKHL